jgi:hypothetical protein
VIDLTLLGSSLARFGKDVNISTARCGESLGLSDGLTLGGINATSTPGVGATYSPALLRGYDETATEAALDGCGVFLDLAIILRWAGQTFTLHCG